MSDGPSQVDVDLVPAVMLVARAQDSATAAPAVAAPQGAPSGPPDSTSDMHLGYAVAGVIFVAYIALLLKRVASVRRSR